MAKEQNDSIGLILLAAGSSERMGHPKQLLSYYGKSLIRHSIHLALQTMYDPIIVVLGAFYDTLLNEIKDEPVKAIYNPDWKKGMGSSIRIGLKTLLQLKPEISGVLIMLCDQPLITKDFLNRYESHFIKGNNTVIATAYESAPGVPALFDKIYFPNLLDLAYNEGAKSILNRFKDKVTLLEGMDLTFDVDTPQDYTQLLEKEQMKNTTFN